MQATGMKKRPADKKAYQCGAEGFSEQQKEREGWKAGREDGASGIDGNETKTRILGVRGPRKENEVCKKGKDAEETKLPLVQADRGSWGEGLPQAKGIFGE